MNYREMLDQFEFLDRRLSHLEHENKYLRERLSRLEYPMQFGVKGPEFTPGSLPQQPWFGIITCQPPSQYGDH